MPRRTQAERRAQTGSALLRAAAELVIEGGVAALTLVGVGERAGYSRGIVTHHFGSKQALVDTLARASQSGFVPDVGAEPGLDRLLVLVDGYIGALDGAGPMRRAFLLLWAEPLTTPELATTFRERDDGFRADLRADVKAGIAAKDIRPGRRRRGHRGRDPRSAAGHRPATPPRSRRRRHQAPPARRAGAVAPSPDVIAGSVSPDPRCHRPGEREPAGPRAAAARRR